MRGTGRLIPDSDPATTCPWRKHDRFEAVRGKADVERHTRDLMALLRGGA